MSTSFHQDYFRFFSVVAFAVLLLCGVYGTAWARFGKMKMRYYAPFDNGVYNPNTITTVEGTIAYIVTVRAPMTPVIIVPTVALRIKIDDGSLLLVQLGPYWYMMNRPFIFKVGQKIKVTGSMKKLAGKKCLVARKVVAGEDEETYRDDFGVPVWSKFGDTFGDIEWEE